MSVSSQILSQLGGQKFITATNAKNIISDSSSIRMKIVENKTKAQYVFISLNSSDTYDIKFIAMNKNFKVTTKIEMKDVYCDQLQEFFTLETGINIY